MAPRSQLFQRLALLLIVGALLLCAARAGAFVVCVFRGKNGRVLADADPLPNTPQTKTAERDAGAARRLLRGRELAQTTVVFPGGGVQVCVCVNVV